MDPRFPIGKFAWNGALTTAERAAAIETIRHTPARFRTAVDRLNAAQLDMSYRDGGWTARQVIHHLPDSHMQAYIRMKLALTEEQPTIKPYLEDKWAALADTIHTRIGLSVMLLELIHERWLHLIHSLSETDFQRTFLHPQRPAGPLTLDWLIALYAWHGMHHIGHLEIVAGKTA